MREAAFARDGVRLAGPLDVDLPRGGRIALSFADARKAFVAALLACGGAKCTSGAVFIGGFDPKIQPTQCKRLAGYVSHELLPLEFASFDRYIEYRAALWSLDPERAVARGRLMLERLAGVHESFAYPLVGALVADPPLLVLDRPQAAFAREMLAVTNGRAVFSTHTSEPEAAAWR